jgi:hypothetical protein
VQIGMSDNTSIEITSGVAPGDQVVVIGQTGLRDGAAIQVVNPTPGGQGGQGQRGQGQRGQGQGGAQATPGADQVQGGAQPTPAAGQGG